MNIRFTNAYVLTLRDCDRKDGSYVVLKDYDVLVDDTRIAFIGTKKETDDFISMMSCYDENYFTVYDCHHNLLMPSFKNMHTHSPMVFARGISNNISLDDWLNKKIIPMEKTMTDEDCYYLSELAMLEYIRGGTTLAFDMYLHMDAIVRAALDMDFRISLVDGATCDTYENEKLEDRYLRYKDVSQLFDKFSKMSDVNPEEYDKSLITYDFGLHSLYANDEKMFKVLSGLIHKYKMPFYKHCCETMDEVTYSKKKYGMTPTEHAFDLGLYDYGGGAFHAVYLNDKDISLFKKKNIYVVSCPASNLKLRSGIAPLNKYKQNGINIALGTDGAGSNDALSMFREMFLAAVLSPTQNPGFAPLSPSDILDMACKNGALMLGKKDLDSLDQGKLADMILIDLHMPNMWPLNDIVSNVVYSANDGNVKMTMCNGKILYEDGKYNLPKVKHCIFKKSKERNTIIQVSEKIANMVCGNSR